MKGSGLQSSSVVTLSSTQQGYALLLARLDKLIARCHDSERHAANRCMWKSLCWGTKNLGLTGPPGI